MVRFSSRMVLWITVALLYTASSKGKSVEKTGRDLDEDIENLSASLDEERQFRRAEKIPAGEGGSLSRILQPLGELDQKRQSEESAKEIANLVSPPSNVTLVTIGTFERDSKGVRKTSSYPKTTGANEMDKPANDSSSIFAPRQAAVENPGERLTLELMKAPTIFEDESYYDDSPHIRVKRFDSSYRERPFLLDVENQNLENQNLENATGQEKMKDRRRKISRRKKRSRYETSSVASFSKMEGGNASRNKDGTFGSIMPSRGSYQSDAAAGTSISRKKRRAVTSKTSSRWIQNPHSRILVRKLEKRDAEVQSNGTVKSKMEIDKREISKKHISTDMKFGNRRVDGSSGKMRRQGDENLRNYEGDHAEPWRQTRTSAYVGQIKELMGKLTSKMEELTSLYAASSMERKKKELSPRKQRGSNETLHAASSSSLIDERKSSKTCEISASRTKRKKSAVLGEKKSGKGKTKRKTHRKWDKWTAWSSCSVTCGKGRQIRWRHCIDKCIAETEMEEKACQLPACGPGKFLGIF